MAKYTKYAGKAEALALFFTLSSIFITYQTTIMVSKGLNDVVEVSSRVRFGETLERSSLCQALMEPMETITPQLAPCTMTVEYSYLLQQAFNLDDVDIPLGNLWGVETFESTTPVSFLAFMTVGIANSTIIMMPEELPISRFLPIMKESTYGRANGSCFTWLPSLCIWKAPNEYYMRYVDNSTGSFITMTLRRSCAIDYNDNWFTGFFDRLIDDVIKPVYQSSTVLCETLTRRASIDPEAASVTLQIETLASISVILSMLQVVLSLISILLRKHRDIQPKKAEAISSVQS